MTEEPKQPGTPEANDLVTRGPDGDPLPHPGGTRMIEKESYERIIEGMKMAADACMHLARHEPDKPWKAIGQRLDLIRRNAVEIAGVDLAMKQKQTAEVSSSIMTWREGRDRFREGLRQAAGGLRQLATCFRGELQWSRMARDIEDLLRKVTAPPRPRGLILPPDFGRN